MLANMEAAAREKEAADLKKRQESKLNDYKGYNTDVWGSEGPDKDLDPKKVRGGPGGGRGIGAGQAKQRGGAAKRRCAG